MKTERKTSPDTVAVLAVPTRVTRMSRPDTPRAERSRATSVPTFVRGSEPKMADRVAMSYVAVRQVAYGEAAS